MIDLSKFDEEIHEIVSKEDLQKILTINDDLQADLGTVLKFLKPLIEMFPDGSFSMLTIMPAVNKLLKDKSFSENLKSVGEVVNKYTLIENTEEHGQQ